MTSYRIVVGVDGSDGALAAVRWAVQEAAARAGTLVLVNGWMAPAAQVDPTGTAVGACRDASFEILEQAAKEAANIDPTVVVTTEAVGLSPAEAIIEASKHADQVVVGTRGRGGFAGLLLGSVSQQVTHHAHCPVTIVPAPAA